MSRRGYIVGVDIGKTNIKFGVFTETLCLLEFTILPSGNSKKEILNIVENKIYEIFKSFNSQILGISFASFGVIDVKNGYIVTSSVIEDWCNVPIKEYFELQFNVPVCVENDVKSALYGEYISRNYDKFSSILYLSIGSNIGVSYIHNGELFRGDSGCFGEISQFSFYNKHHYTLGDLLGGQGISRQYYDRTGNKISCKEIFMRSVKGDRIARDIFMQMITLTSRVLHFLNMCFDPTVIILGGGVVCNNDCLFEKIKESFVKNQRQTRKKLILSMLGDKVGTYGAASLLSKKYSKNSKGRN